MKDKEIMSVTIITEAPDKKGYFYSSLELPATNIQIEDALHKARWLKDANGFTDINIDEWLKCRNENMLMRFYYKNQSKKMLKKLPVFVSKQWECPTCGSKYNDPEELETKIEKIENLAVGVMAAWVVFNISVILIWYFAFQHQGLYAVTLVLLIGLLAMLFMHSGLRQTALQRKKELGKMECEIMSCENHC